MQQASNTCIYAFIYIQTQSNEALFFSPIHRSILRKGAFCIFFIHFFFVLSVVLPQSSLWEASSTCKLRDQIKG